MSLSMQDATGRDSWANTTPHMNLHDPRSYEQLDPPSESKFHLVVSVFPPFLLLFSFFLVHVFLSVLTRDASGALSA